MDWKNIITGKRTRPIKNIITGKRTRPITNDTVLVKRGVWLSDVNLKALEGYSGTIYVSESGNIYIEVPFGDRDGGRSVFKDLTQIQTK